MRLSQEGLFDKPVTNPYFVSMAKQVRLCARCGHRTRLAGTLSPNAAYEVCDACGYFFTHVAPEWARVDARQSMPKSKGAAKPVFTVIKGGID